MAENKVIFGLKNVHYAVITEETDDLLTYGEPVRIRGAVSMTMTPQGEQTEFYADDILYYGETSNTGYEVGLEIAKMPEQFRIDALGEVVDANGVLLEDANAKPKKIAVMFEFDGDENAVRHCLPYCSVARPTQSSSTKTATAEPTTQELTLRATPSPVTGLPKYSTSSMTDAAIYDDWYNAVYEPNMALPEVAAATTLDKEE